MLRPRIIPCLLIRNGGLVKTVKFGDSKYVGDPLNAVRIFNEKEVDEIIVLDIDASVRRLEPNYVLIKKLAAECRMPLCYGGGVKTVEQIQRLVSLGVEKVSISSAAVENPELINEAASKVGSQSISVVMDVKKDSAIGKYKIFTHNGTKDTGHDPVKFAVTVEKLGVGEIVVNNIDLDGVMKGYDLELISNIRAVTKRPMTVVGGAGSVSDFKCAIAKFGCIGVAAGSFFVFKGVYRAVLISYPSRTEKDSICFNAG